MNTAARHPFRDPQGRRLGAIAALVLGLFVGLTLLPIPLTGPVGSALGKLLWQGLGVGALGFPLLGVGVALAGFDRLPKLDMKRAAFLVGGLSVLVPSLVGLVIVSQIPSHEFPPSAADWLWPEKAVGIIPAILSTAIYSQIGFLGGLLIWFLALSALTLLTFAWHPLQRLEKPSPPVPLSRAAGDGVQEVRAENEPEFPARRSTVLSDDPAKLKKRPRKGDRIDPAVLAAVKAEDEAELPPIELLHPPPAQDIDAGEAQLDRLGQVLIDTLKTFKVDATPGGRTTGPVVTQFEIVPAPGVKAGRIAALADDLAITIRAPSVRVAPIPGKGAVGVEVPNPTARMVMLRELFES
ncbi:MAG: DNA translocase FtsK 4TM domain-containing protein, partial [Acidobacteria bacterium]|nr:DNA translocase FtsK 4TM domain-containing protein [Acidobacteriota bacterium]